jgi:hypothetical protein
VFDQPHLVSIHRQVQLCRKLHLLHRSLVLAARLQAHAAAGTITTAVSTSKVTCTVLA